MSLHLGAGVLVRIVAALVAVCASLMAVPRLAYAEPFPTPQQDTYRADWVEGLRSEDLAPSRAAICMVDSGIAITPDTPPDNPDGPILLRTSITPDTMPGTPPSGSGDAGLHGTHMAAAAIAPRNEWGTVGLHPLGRVISVRALGDGETEFSADAVRTAVSRCRTFQGRYPRMVAIGLSLGRAVSPTQKELEDYQEEVARARQQSISILAAAGNAPQSHTQFPADSAGVLALGASGAEGDACPYATADARVDLFGPACGVLETIDVTNGTAEVGDGGGSSMATSWAAEAIALLCDLVPDLTGTRAQELLVQSARQVGPRRVLDIEAAARAAGAGAAVDRARARILDAQQPPAPPAGADASQSASTVRAPAAELVRAKSRLAIGRISARWRAGRLTISVSGREPSGAMRVAVYGMGDRRPILRRVARSSRMTVRVRRPPRRVSVQLLPAPGSTHLRSAVVRCSVVVVPRPRQPSPGSGAREEAA